MSIVRLSGWIPWFSFAGALGILVVALLVLDPKVPTQAHKLESIFYPEPIARPGYVLTKERIGDRDVASYLLSAEETTVARRPVVILIHGGSMTDVLEYKRPQYKGEYFISRYDHVPYRFAEAGFLVVVIDAWWAGERYLPKHAEMVRAEPIRSIFRGWVQTRVDVSSVIDYLLTRDDVDPTRIGVAGWSGGGIISLMAIAKDKRVGAAVAWKGAPDFMTMIQLRGQGWLVDDSLDTDEGFLAELLEGDAIYHVEEIPPRPVALIGNYEDPAVPRQLAERFVERLRPHYREHPERLYLKLYETPKPTHDLSRESLEEGCEWLIERFRETGS